MAMHVPRRKLLPVNLDIARSLQQYSRGMTTMSWKPRKHTPCTTSGQEPGCCMKCAMLIFDVWWAA